MITANSTVLDNNVPRPQSYGVPLLIHEHISSLKTLRSVDLAIQGLVIWPGVEEKLAFLTSNLGFLLAASDDSPLETGFASFISTSAMVS